MGTKSFIELVILLHLIAINYLIYKIPNLFISNLEI